MSIKKIKKSVKKSVKAGKEVARGAALIALAMVACPVAKILTDADDD